MDELPVPCGSWQEAHDKAQSKNNLQLAVGVVVLIGTIVIVRIDIVKFLISSNLIELLIHNDI